MAELSSSTNLQKYQTMVKLHPNDAEAFFQLGREYEMANNLSEAVRAFEQVVSLRPSHALAYLHRGLLYAKNAELRGALEEIGKATRLDPHVLNVVTDPAYAAFYKKEVKEALDAFARPVAINPNDGVAHHHRSHHLRLRHLQSAVSRY